MTKDRVAQERTHEYKGVSQNSVNPLVREGSRQTGLGPEKPMSPRGEAEWLTTRIQEVLPVFPLPSLLGLMIALPFEHSSAQEFCGAIW